MLKKLLQACAALGMLLWAGDSTDANLIMMTGAVATVFDNSGNPWTFTNQVAAINYDNGGQNVGFKVLQSSQTCADGASYRPDYVNFKTSTAISGIPYQIGCSNPGNWYSYKVNFGTAGSKQVTLWVATPATGPVWTIYVDGTQVATAVAQGGGDFNWSTFIPVTSTSFNSTGGVHTMRIEGTSGEATYNSPGDFVAWQGGVPGAAPSVPAGAAAANFNTLVDNWDFTVQKTGNWLGCSPWDGAAHEWYQANNPTNPYDSRVPCEITQVIDPNNTNLALMIPWKSTYPHAWYYQNIIMTMSPDYETSAGGSPDTLVGPPKYPNAYFEMEFRVASSAPRSISPHTLPGGNISAWMIFAGGGGNFEGYEGDLFEIFDVNLGTPPAANPTSTIHDWGGSGGAEQYFQAPGDYDVQQYHKWGMRRSSDGTNTAFCTYVDGVFQGCSKTFTNSSSGPGNTKRWGIVMNAGMTCDYQNESTPGGMITSCFAPEPFSEQMYIKTVRVWSCSTWSSDMCNTGMLNTAP